MNPVTYPNFLKFLKLKRIETAETEMSFSVSRDAGVFEWSGSSLATVFTQPSNILNWEMYAMIYDILRFNTFAPDLLDADETPQLRKMSISSYLDEHGYSQAFRDNYLMVLPALVGVLIESP
jgi:predicted NAD/FAD-binding protein